MKCETCGGLSCTSRRATCEDISQTTGILPTSVFRILTKDLQKRKMCPMVPHYLTAEQKQKRLETATFLKQIFNVEGQAFLYRTVVVDETWVRDFEPELKSQSKDRRNPTSPRPKKFRRAQSKVKKMMIFAYDHREIIMPDRVPCGTSVTAEYCREWMQKLRRKMHKTRTGLLGDGPLILKDSARPHLRKVVNDLLS